MNALGFGTGFRLNRRGGAGFDFSGGALPAGASLTRASVATRCDSSGAIANAAIDVPRFDYDPVSHAPRGLLVEPAASNLARNSQDWAQASWTRSSANITATRLVESTTTAVMPAQMAVALTSGTPVTTSCIASEEVGSVKRYLCLTRAGGDLAVRRRRRIDRGRRADRERRWGERAGQSGANADRARRSALILPVY